MAGETIDKDERSGKDARWLELLLDIAMISNSAESMGGALTSSITRVCEHNGWYAGHARALALERNYWWSAPEDRPDDSARELAHHWAAHVLTAGEAHLVTDFSVSPPAGRPSDGDFALPRDPPAEGGAIATPLVAGGRVLGAMVFLSRRPLIEEGDDDAIEGLLRVMESIGAQMGRAIERWTLVRRVVEEGEREREALGREVHDGLAQQLVGVNLLARNLRRRLDGGSGHDESERWDLLLDSLSGALEQARALARGLSSDRLTDASDHLVVQLEELAEVTRTGHEVACSVQTEGIVRLDDELARTQLVRIAREAVFNALRHARPSRIDLRVTSDGQRLTLEIRDDGTGPPEDIEGSSGMGVTGMRYRAGIIGATLEIEANPTGGTIVRCSIDRR